MSKRPRPSDDPDSNDPKRRKVEEEKELDEKTIEQLCRFVCEESEKRRVETVRGFALKGQDVHADSELFLRFESKYGQAGMVKMLLELGADARANNDESIREACGDGREEMVKILLEHGADPFAVTTTSPNENINLLLKNHMDKLCEIIPLPRDITHDIIRPYMTIF